MENKYNDLLIRYLSMPLKDSQQELDNLILAVMMDNNKIPYLSFLLRKLNKMYE